MAKRLIRFDQFGIYVRTGGYGFRPQEIANREFFPKDSNYKLSASGSIPTDKIDTNASRIKHGDHVNAVHVGGTTTARVGDEIWVSSCIDPQYRNHG